MTTFIIAEAGSSHDNDLNKAYRLIEAAKECGADAVKFQWTSDGIAMSKRRGLGGMESNTSIMYRQYLQKPVSWLESLKAHADKVGIEFMCTVYLIEDIATIAPLVKRFKISACEGAWCDFVRAHHGYGKPVIRSHSESTVTVPAKDGLTWIWKYGEWETLSSLWCVSEYPTPIEHVGLRSNMRSLMMSGLSDHTGHVLTGAAAVAAGATIAEAHIKLGSTAEDNPDFPHSLVCDESDYGYTRKDSPFGQYVQNIRTVEKML